MNENPFGDKSQHTLYSIGTDVMMKKFVEEYHLYKYGLVMINIGTLLRNWQTREISSFAMVDSFEREFRVLIEEVTGVMAETNAAVQPKVIIYAEDLVKCISKKNLRNQTETTKKLNKAVHIVMSRRDKLFGSKGDGIVNGIPVRFVAIEHQLPHVHNALFSNIQQFTSHRKVIMISHSPIDYHVSINLDDLILLESHTGNWRKTHTLSKKVFGERYAMIPFNPTTHLCLGDTKGCLKPLLSVKEKKELVALSESEHWNTRSFRYIHESILRHFRDHGF